MTGSLNSRNGEIHGQLLAVKPACWQTTNQGSAKISGLWPKSKAATHGDLARGPRVGQRKTIPCFRLSLGVPLGQSEKAPIETMLSAVVPRLFLVRDLVDTRINSTSPIQTMENTLIQTQLTHQPEHVLSHMLKCLPTRDEKVGLVEVEHTKGAHTFLVDVGRGAKNKF